MHGANQYPEGQWKVKDGELIMPDRQQQFLQWLLTMPEDREPRTLKAYAEQNKVHVQTLYTWKKDPSFRERWDKALAELNISPDRTQDVINALFKNAKAGDTKAAELYLRMVDKISPPKIVFEEKGVQQMTDDELAQALAERQRHLRAV